MLTIDSSDRPKKVALDENALPEPQPAPFHMLLKSFNLCLASTVISVTTVLNFSLAASTAVLLGIPLSISSPTTSLYTKVGKVGAYHVLFAPLWFILYSKPMSQSIWDWQVLGVWYAPFLCIVYLPLVLQAMIVCMLDPEFYY
ncbi:MAG TPA: hypothetical protein VGO47_15055 [Chlamydiales bacterium]|nr:hypothetical protein [Chlamydiales bacterium]